ncbi:MAG: hypothetical protein NVSMB62_26450 [Acidobacteriaceae bacterium]
MYRELESRFAAAGDSRDAIYAHISRLRGDLEHMNLQVLSLYLTAQLKRPEVQKDPHLKIRCLEVKGNVDLNLDGVSARPAFEELEKVANQIGEKQIAARASGDLGIVAFLEGNTSEAKWRVARAIASAILHRDAAAESRYLTLFGAGMVQQHHADQALWALDKAITIAENNSDVVAVPQMAYLGKVQALSQLGRESEANALIRRALDDAIRSNFVGYQADLLVETGRIDARHSMVAEAIQVFEKAARLSATISYNRGLADANAELADLYRQIGDLRKAADSAAKCVAAHQQLGELHQIPHHLAIQAEIETAAGEFAQADQTYSNAEEVIKLMLTHAPSTGSKKGVIKAMSEIFLGHFQLAADYEKDLPKAFGIIEEARGRTLADRLGDGIQRRAQQRQTATETDAQRRLALVQLRLLDSKNASDRAALSDALATLETGLPTATQPRPVPPIPLREVRSQLQDGEVLLEYVLGEKKSYCISITRAHIAIVDLPDRHAIEKLAAQYLADIKAQKNGVERSRALFRATIAPVADYRLHKSVIIVPDGILNRVPFSAMMDEEGEFLIRSHEISYAPSGTVLTLMRVRHADIAKSLLAVGNVPYQGKRPTESWLPNIFRGVSELRRDQLGPLPSTDDEVQSIRSYMGGNGVVLSGKAATESAFKTQAARNYGTIHLAVHAIADQTNPDRAALIFAPEKQSSDDGLLQVREIQTLPLDHTDLVTLSACDTSVGRVEGQEGVSSIVYAFLYAGANSAVASLWTAEDSSTAALMKAFYRHLSAGETKSGALRNAQLEFLARGNPPPFYWASFQLIGDGARTLTGDHGVPVQKISTARLPMGREYPPQPPRNLDCRTSACGNSQ